MNLNLGDIAIEGRLHPQYQNKDFAPIIRKNIVVFFIQVSFLYKLQNDLKNTTIKLKVEENFTHLWSLTYFFLKEPVCNSIFTTVHRTLKLNCVTNFY